MSAILKMQLTNAPGVNEFPRVVFALHEERILRYFSAAERDMDRAFRYYLWNCALCESFHFALHVAEIVCRNAIHKALIARFGERWFEDTRLLRLIDKRYRNELRSILNEERLQHGNGVTGHHVVSASTFGLWEHFSAKRFDRLLWAKGVGSVFPNAPKEITRQDIQNLIESVRRWRNRIAHHRAIFDKGPMRKHQDALNLIKFVCADTYAWVAKASRVPMALQLRPA